MEAIKALNEVFQEKDIKPGIFVISGKTLKNYSHPIHEFFAQFGNSVTFSMTQECSMAFPRFP